MIHQLPIEHHQKARPLFQEMTFNLITSAVLDGTSPGTVYVDDPAHPRAAFLDSVEGSFLAGNPNNPVWTNALSETLNTVLQDGGAIYLVTQRAWEPHLPTLLSGRTPTAVLRQHYLCTYLQLDWRATLPDGYTVQPIIRALLQRPDLHIPAHIPNWINSNWGSLDNYEQLGFGVCTIHQNQVVSWSIADCISSDECEIGIHTAPAHRQKGLAAITAAAAVDHAFSHGLRAVGWHCNADNIGSWKTAQRVGFHHERDYTQYYISFI